MAPFDYKYSTAFFLLRFSMFFSEADRLF